MALSKINTASIAADAVDNTILDLTDDYALTGTVTGATSTSVFNETPADKSWTNHNYSRAAWVGADGYTRSGGYIYSGNDSYSGDGFTTAFDGSTNHVLRIRVQTIGSDLLYMGLAFDIAASVSDAQAATSAGNSIYGLTGTWTGAASVTHFGGYFSDTHCDPPRTNKSIYINVWTAGSGSSRKMYVTWSHDYLYDPRRGYIVEAAGSNPPNGSRIINTTFSVGAGGQTIGTKDFAMLVGEAGGGNHNWIIDSYGTY